MALNPNIPLSGQHPDFGGMILDERDRKEQRTQQNQLFNITKQRQEKALAAADAAAKEAADRRNLESIAKGALEVKPLLDNIETIPQAVKKLDRRIEEIEARGGDASDTREIREMIQQGRIDQARAGVNSAIQVAERTGILKQGAFTLGQGETRFSGSGEEIASGSPDVGTKQFREGEEFVTRRVVNGQPDMSDEGVLARSKIDRVNRIEQGGPGAFDDPRTKSQRGAAFEDARTKYNASGELAEQIETIFPRLNELPNTVGFRGRAGMLAGGALTAMGQDELANMATEAISGGDQETISAMQTQLQLIRARIRPLVTGDEGARQSDSERKISGDVIGLIEAIEGPADLTRAFPQVIGAMKQLYEETWVRRYNVANQNPEIDAPFDLTTEDGILQFGQRLSDQGLDLETARRILTRLQRIQQDGV